MSDFVSFYTPLTLEQVDALVDSAYKQLPTCSEPYYGFLDHAEAVKHAESLANCYGIGFLLRESCYRKDATESVFFYGNLADVCPWEPEPDHLARWQGENFPFAQVSLAGTPHRGTRLCRESHPWEDATGDLLEATGFYRLDEIYPEPSVWYDPNDIWAWDRFYNALARQCHLDDEDASEQGFQYLWKCAQPFLVRLKDPPHLRYDAWTDEGYVICLDDTEYLAYKRTELGKHNPNWVYWAFETERLVDVLNHALQAKGIPERCYLSEWSNDSKMLFLTEEQHRILTTHGYLRTYP